MKTLPSSVRIVLSLLFTAGSVIPALAQTETTKPAARDESDSSSDQVVNLSPFVLTEDNHTPWNAQKSFSGSRVAQDLLDIPANISVLTSDFIKDTGATNLRDTLRYSGSGVNVLSSYQDAISVRGFNTTPLIDGIPDYFNDLRPFYDVDRIEIVKGPTALVYGNYSVIGGSVNYVTKTPTATPKGTLNVTAGNFDLYSADLTLSGPVNSKGTVRYRGTVGGSHLGGFKQSEYNDNILGSGVVDWNVSDKLLLRVGYRSFSHRKRDFNRSIMDPATNRLANFPDSFSTSADWSKISSHADNYRFDAILSLSSDLTLRAILNWNVYQYDYKIPQPFPGLIPSEGPNYQQIQQRLVYFTYHRELWDYQLDLNWKKTFGPFKSDFNTGYAFNASILGSDLYLGTLPNIIISAPFSARPPAPPPTAWTPAAPNAGATNSGWSVYAEERLTALHDKLIVSVGVRMIDKSSVVAANPKSTTVPRYGVVYKLNNEFSLYASYAKSFAPLNGNDVFGKPFTNVYGEDKEGGVKFNLLNGKLFGSVAYFDLVNDPVTQQSQFLVNGMIVFGVLQTGKQTTDGVEADLGTYWDFSPGRLFVFGTYYKGDPRDQYGARAVRSVANKETLFVKYQLTTGPLNGTFVGGGVSRMGDQVGVGIPIEPGYTFYSAIAGYEAKNWSLAINVDNLANDKRLILGSEASFSVYVAAPLTTKATLSYRW